MSSFFESLGKKVGETAQAAAKKSGDLMETTKLSMAINGEEDKINKLFNQMGKKVFEAYRANPDILVTFHEECEMILTIQQGILGLKQKIADIKNIKACPSCYAEMDRSISFCPKCGAKQEASHTTADEYHEPINIPVIVICPSCNSTVPDGSAFCTNCGTKVG